MAIINVSDLLEDPDSDCGFASKPDRYFSFRPEL